MVDNLKERIRGFGKALPKFRGELNSAFGHLESEPKTSATKARTVLEGVVAKAYIKTMGKAPKKCQIGDMLAENQFTKKIDSNIVNKMRNVQNYGNSSVHVKIDEDVHPPPDLPPKDATKILDDLCDVLDWFLRTHQPEVHEVEPHPDRAHVQTETSALIRRIAFAVLAMVVIGSLAAVAIWPRGPGPGPVHERVDGERKRSAVAAGTAVAMLGSSRNGGGESAFETALRGLELPASVQRECRDEYRALDDLGRSGQLENPTWLARKDRLVEQLSVQSESLSGDGLRSDFEFGEKLSSLILLLRYWDSFPARDELARRALELLKSLQKKAPMIGLPGDVSDEILALRSSDLAHREGRDRAIRALRDVLKHLTPQGPGS